MRTGLTKKEKVTELYTDESIDYLGIVTHNSRLKNALLAMAKEHPELCKIVEDFSNGGYEVEVKKGCLTFRTMKPINNSERKRRSAYAKQNPHLPNLEYK